MTFNLRKKLAQSVHGTDWASDSWTSQRVNGPHALDESKGNPPPATNNTNQEGRIQYKNVAYEAPDGSTSVTNHPILPEDGSAMGKWIVEIPVQTGENPNTIAEELGEDAKVSHDLVSLVTTRENAMKILDSRKRPGMRAREL